MLVLLASFITPSSNIPQKQIKTRMVRIGGLTKYAFYGRFLFLPGCKTSVADPRENIEFVCFALEKKKSNFFPISSDGFFFRKWKDLFLTVPSLCVRHFYRHRKRRKNIFSHLYFPLVARSREREEEKIGGKGTLPRLEVVKEFFSRKYFLKESYFGDPVSVI